jgi:hypothetical protein
MFDPELVDASKQHDPDSRGNIRCLEVSSHGGMEEQDARFYIASIVLALKFMHGYCLFIIAAVIIIIDKTKNAK